MNRILIVDDERPIAHLIEMNLTHAGYLCRCAYDGEEAVSLVDSEPFDLILLDVMLPLIDGYDLLEYIRPLEIPVIFLTAKSDVRDKVRGLKLGADDYLTKPFEIIELLARVETVLRRYHKTDRLIQLADLQIDTLSRQVRKGGQEIPLTKKEYELLLLLAQNKNVALFRETIYERIWGGGDMGDSRTVDLHIQRLRKKLGWESRIVAVYKVGYRLEAEE
ncbi:MAG: response regulator transcription factor [Clostridiaceae bacterium]|jgi:two-component system alkaline phosphatase synthesis response regulator PhoP|nr:response regulator transcription factor [Clostridiaceae bacterium]